MKEKFYGCGSPLGGGQTQPGAGPLDAHAGERGHARACGDNIDSYHVWLISLGTGAKTLPVAPNDNGIFGWFDGGHLVSVLMEGPVYVTCETAPILIHRMGGTYTRVHPSARTAAPLIICLPVQVKTLCSRSRLYRL